ncbi:MAG: pentapeptide repeat-containing protein [Gemmatimonadales bacterium]|nr:pentapeptide repeat-containing protein [Gemmatimonadales bacterium]
MAEKSHLELFKEGPGIWNRWRQQEPNVRPDLSDVDFERDIFEKRSFYDTPAFSTFNLTGTNLNRISARNSSFLACVFDECSIYHSDLCYSSFDLCSFRGSSLRVSKLGSAQFDECVFEGTDLSYCSAEEARFTHSRFSNCVLDNMRLVKVNLGGTSLEDVSVYGISAWDLSLRGTVQRDIRVPTKRAMITVDNLELAQFIHLLVSNSKLRGIIDTITSKVVLILGRFTPERKAVLQRIKKGLAGAGYVPVLFDFSGPASRDLSESISTLAHLSRFVLVDLSDPRSVPHELATIIPILPSVPVQPVVLSGQEPYAMFSHWSQYPWVLPILDYHPHPTAISQLIATAIRACEAAIQERRPT